MTDLWELTKKAKAGDVEAQLAVAHAFETGEGVKRDEKEALKWYKSAADQGDAEGCFKTGKLLPRFNKDGDESKINQEALAYFKAAAKLGHVKAQIEYAIYQPGYYAPITSYQIDVEERLLWLTKAAEQGDVGAMRELGLTYYNEQNAEYIQTDYKKAFSWFKKAAEQGDVEATFYLAECYHHERGVEYDSEKLFHLYKEAAEAGIGKAMGEVGICYLYGIGTDYPEYEDEREREAVRWFKKGSEQEDPDVESYYHLGHCLQYGIGTDADEREALLCFREAVSWAEFYRTRVPKAECRVGMCYYNGVGTDVDYKEAVYWFEQAAEQNFAQALYFLGECYYHGHGVRKNRKKAVEYYHRAVNTADLLEERLDEYDKVLCALGRCYLNGFGTEKNLLKAVYWYTMAENYGAEEAREELDKLLDRK